MIEDFSMAFRQLRMKKSRTFLILLGISIGVAAVVGVASLGEGIRVNAVEEIQRSHDLTLIEVSPGLSSGNLVLITEAKVDAIKEYGVAVSPYVSDAYVTTNKTYFEVVGISKEYWDVKGLEIDEGAVFEEGTHQIVSGSDIGEKFEKIESAGVGDLIEAKYRSYGQDGRSVDKDMSFDLAGVLKPTGTDTDDSVFIDLNTALELDEKDVYDGIMVKVDSSDQAPVVRAAIERLGLSCYSAQDEIDSVNRIMNGVTLVLTFFSSISLIVGGLMIVNTMVVSVYERTREIGIAKATGASEFDIIRMFLSECIIIGIVGGILGDFFGILFSLLIDGVGKPMLVAKLGISDFEHLTAINTEILVAGFLVALIVSVISGIYPAWRAAKLDPVRALRQL